MSACGRRRFPSLRTSLVRSFAHAARLTVGDSGNRQVLWLCVAVAGLCNPLLQMVTPLVETALDADARSVGLIVGAFGIGGVVGGISANKIAAPGRRASVCTGMIVVCGTAMFVYGLSSSVPMAMALFSIVGLAYVVTITVLFSTVQLRVAEEFRGRTLAVVFSIFNASYAVGSIVQGALADAIGVRRSTVAAGAGLALIGCVGLCFSARLDLEARVVVRPDDDPLLVR